MNIHNDGRYLITQSDLDRFKEKPNSLIRVLKNFPKPGVAICESEEVKKKFLALVSWQAYFSDTSKRHDDLFKRIILAFRNTFGLPFEDLPDELCETVLLYPREEASEGEEQALPFSKKLLSFNLDFALQFFKDDGQNQVIIPLSRAGLAAYKAHLYSGLLPDITPEIAVELTAFAKKICDVELIKKLEDLKTTFLLKEENIKDLLDPTNKLSAKFLKRHAREFTEWYLNLSNIEILDKKIFKISLENFIELFRATTNPCYRLLQDTLARVIDCVEINNGDCLSTLSFIKKKYSSAIVDLTFKPKNKQQLYLSEIWDKQLFPNVNLPMQRTVQHISIHQAHIELDSQGDATDAKDPYQELERRKMRVKSNPKNLKEFKSLIHSFEKLPCTKKNRCQQLKPYLVEFLNRFPEERSVFMMKLAEITYYTSKNWEKIQQVCAEALKAQFNLETLQYFVTACLNLNESGLAISRIIRQIEEFEEKGTPSKEIALTVISLFGELGMLYRRLGNNEPAKQSLKTAINHLEILGLDESVKNKVNSLRASYGAILASMYLEEGNIKSAESISGAECSRCEENFWVQLSRGDFCIYLGRSPFHHYFCALKVLYPFANLTGNLIDDLKTVKREYREGSPIFEQLKKILSSLEKETYDSAKLKRKRSEETENPKNFRPTSDKQNKTDTSYDPPPTEEKEKIS